jgi:hypothetical protein
MTFLGWLKAYAFRLAKGARMFEPTPDKLASLSRDDVGRLAAMGDIGQADIDRIFALADEAIKAGNETETERLAGLAWVANDAAVAGRWPLNAAPAADPLPDWALAGLQWLPRNVATDSEWHGWISHAIREGYITEGEASPAVVAWHAAQERHIFTHPNQPLPDWLEQAFNIAAPIIEARREEGDEEPEADEPDPCQSACNFDHVSALNIDRGHRD